MGGYIAVMLRGGHGSGQHAGRPGPVCARASARCQLRGSWVCHGQEILFHTCTGTSPPRWPVGRMPISFFFFSLKLLKKNKTRAKAHRKREPDSRAWAESWTKPGNFRSSTPRPATHGFRPTPSFSQASGPIP